MNEAVTKNMVMMWHRGDNFLLAMKDILMLEQI